MLPKLTPQEQQAMTAIWKIREGNIKMILDNIDSKPKPPYTTLASTIKNLEKKGYLTSRPLGNMNLYKPAVAEREFTDRSLATLVKEHFDNSYKDLVAFFAEQKKISPKELKEIIQLIENKKAKQ